MPRPKGVHIKNHIRLAILIAITLAAIVITALLPRIPQDPAYHNFADQRAFLALANFMDVASNVPFLLVGLWGLLVVHSRRTVFLADSERWPYLIFFLGVALTSLGSSYYHLHPNNARLVWDHLPMTLGFMAVVAVILTERVSRKAGVASLPLVASAGVASVAYWYATETSGHGDMRPYGLVQFGSLLIVLVILLLFRSRYTQQKWFAIALAAYVAAKLLETFDRAVYATLRIVSGHTLKHIVAAGAACCLVQMLLQRTVASPASVSSQSVRSSTTRKMKSRCYSPCFDWSIMWCRQPCRACKPRNAIVPIKASLGENDELCGEGDRSRGSVCRRSRGGCEVV
ncbi:MAG TPA: hypothetical protein VEI49_07930 [Terriglobales bacterium]|nr:hypothetical protein [Terriglobales bacterium]